MRFLSSFASRASVLQFLCVMAAAIAVLVAYAAWHFNVLLASEAAWAWHRKNSIGELALFYAVMVAMTWPIWAAAANRLHDAGAKGRGAAWVGLPWLVFWAYLLMQMVSVEGRDGLELSSVTMLAGWFVFLFKQGMAPAVGDNEWGPGRRLAGGWDEMGEQAAAAATLAMPLPELVGSKTVVPARQCPQVVAIRPALTRQAAPSFGRRR